MSIVTSFPFDNTANYTKVSTEVSGGAGKLALIGKPSQVFNQDFANDSGFTYDSNQVEFVAGVLRQKDNKLADSLGWATYTTDVNLNSGGGVLTGTAVGGASVLGGKLDLKGSTLQFVTYDAVGNADSQQVGALRYKYTPNYSGVPGIVQLISSIIKATGDRKNRIELTHRGTSGDIILEIRDLNDSILMSHIAVLGWNPTASVTYEIEINWDLTAGATRVFIDGVLQGSTNTTTGTRDSNIGVFSIGGGFNGAGTPDFEIEDVIYFEAVQHTANYAPGYTLEESKYLASTVDLPGFSYILQGTIQSLDVFATTEVDAPRYTFEGQYWNGSWVASDGSYAQAIDKATAITNLPTLDMTGQTEVSVQAVFAGSNTQSSVDDLTLTYTGQQFPLEGTLLTNNSFVAQEINSFVVAETTPANTSIFYAIDVGGVYMYWAGVWLLSDGTSAEANTLADIQANIGTLLSVNSNIKILTILTTTSVDTATPEIDLITVNYDFGAFEPSDPNQCQVYGYLKDSENQPIVGATVSVVPNRDDDQYKEAADRVIAKTISKTTDANGFFSMNLIISDDFEVVGAQPMQYVLSISITGQALPVFKNGTVDQILFEVPNLASVNITDQIGAI